MAKLTDKQRKRIIADRVDGLSLRKLADKYHVSVSTIRNVIGSDTQIAQMCTQKKEQNTLDMLAYMDSKKEQAQGIIDLYLSALADPEKLERASINNIATALGIIIDKFTATDKNAPTNNIENMASLAEMLRHPQPNRNIAEFEAVDNE